MPLLVVLGALVWAVPARAFEPDARWREGYTRLAALGRGFVIWESNRPLGGKKRWRIWYRDLDGSGLRQLSPDEKDRDHFCPHVSPDGRSFVYLSYPRGHTCYKPIPKGVRVPMRLARIDGSSDRVIVESARAYFEDRAAVWLSPEELIYIHGDGTTRRLNVTTGRSVQVTTEGRKEYGWLVNTALTHATYGWATFSPYDAKRRAVSERGKIGGCQPYFTRDGTWGFWTAGTGGPFKRFNLATRETSVIIKKNDPRMPKGRGHLYFPMASSNGRLFAFAASPDQVDHFDSDYDIFVARCDPQRLALVGDPVRYTFDGGCDRFPDVFLAELELGTHRGEAPYSVTLVPPGERGRWRWDFGDGRRARGSATGKHTYPRPGEYAVEARREQTVLHGRVIVDRARPPEPVRTVLRGREIRVVFDEPVRFPRLKLRLASGRAIRRWSAGDDGRSVVIELEDELDAEDELSIEGVCDRALAPNYMAPRTLAVRPTTWPSNPDGLVFVWRTGNAPNLVLDPATGAERACTVTGRGNARLDHDYAMVLTQGAFRATPADEGRLLSECRRTNALTIEAILRPDNLRQGGPARIVTFSTDSRSRNFTLGQDGDRLILRLRTPRTGDNGYLPQVTLSHLSTEEPTHVVVSYSGGRLLCWKNGRRVKDTRDVQGDFSNWSPQHLLFGDEWNGRRDWAGTLEGVAVYSRALHEEEARANYEAYRDLLISRRAVPRVEIEGRLTSRSRMPTLKEIVPYRRALVVNEYRVEKVLSGSCPHGRIRVAQWAILDGRVLTVPGATGSGTVRLAVEALDSNPQVEAVYRSDTLKEDLDCPMYYDLAP